MKSTLVLFGAGHMGSAIASGMLRIGKTNLRIIDPNPSKLEKFRTFGVRTDTVCSELTPNDVLMFAMPPQAFGAFSDSAKNLHCHQGLTISVMAGIRIIDIQQAMCIRNVVRSIPNTPSEVFEGMTVYCRSSSVEDTLAQDARDIFESFGRAVEVRDETLIDPATALCGGGPAFVAYFADALQEFGVRAGISTDAVREITVQTLRGTAALIAATGKPAKQICSEVMTRGGTTEQGIWHLDAACLRRTVQEALQKATTRSRELGQVTHEFFLQSEVAK